MNDELKLVFEDLKVLISNSKEDYDNEVYSSYEDYIIEYNRILDICHRLELFNNFDKISKVPEKEKAMYGIGFTATEVAKHRAVITKSEQIFNRIKSKIPNNNKSVNHLEVIKKICSKFHTVARQIRSRYNNRNTLDVNDEYDVQDLLHALLKIEFDDIRAEEWSPSHAGGSKRMDFLLKKERTIIEVKKTRKRLADKKLGEELLIDIGTYETHPDCKILVCFIYDPEGRIGNPIGLENDLESKSKEELTVQVNIFPK
jgi:hypothetical protein